MTAMLVVLTFAALALSGALAYYVLRLNRRERERSDARAAALADALGATPSFDAGGRDEGRDFSRADRADLSPVAPATVPTPMFGARADDAATPSRRWLVPALGALVVSAVLAGTYGWNRGGTPLEAAREDRPLELLALTHQRQGDSIVVSGLIRNPVAGRPLSGLTAVAFSFNRQGTFLTSGRAMVDYPRLAAGDESPFSVTLPQASGVSRYRVSFRTDSGVLAHVDRREPSVSVTPASTEVRR
jgi:hypothetical protein